MLFSPTKKTSVLISLLLLAPSLGFSTSTKANLKPDNSGVNTKSTLTAEDQVRGTAADVETTRQIRKHLVADDGLSTYGKNVKIITLGGVVTLKGPVNSATEKSKIERHARMIVKATQIHNELEVVPSNSSAR